MTIESPGQALRRKANRALRLARAVSDEQAAHALRHYATSLFEEAETLERGHELLPPPLQHSSPQHSKQQIQPGTEDETAATCSECRCLDVGAWSHTRLPFEGSYCGIAARCNLPFVTAFVTAGVTAFCDTSPLSQCHSALSLQLRPLIDRAAQSRAPENSAGGAWRTSRDLSVEAGKVHNI
jgi:hypothetical protein